MIRMSKALVYGEVLEGSGPVDPGYGRPVGPGHVSPPIQLPPTPPDVIYPQPPGGIQLPVEPDWPVVIPQPPEKPGPEPPGVDNTLPEAPPGTIWPPPNLPVHDKSWILIAIIGSGGHKKYWLKYDPNVIWPKPSPPAQPK